MGNFHILTKEEIVEKLKSMEVGEGKELPIKTFSFLTPNPECNPDEFSQEIEDSEDRVDLMEEVKKEISKQEFDWVWNNTIGSIKKNSPKWYENHSKICKVKFHPMQMYVSSTYHSDCSRNYYSEETLQRILDFANKWGGIIGIA